MENSVFNILITKCRYNISDNHQSDVTINSFDISFLSVSTYVHVQHYTLGWFFFISFTTPANNEKRIHIYLPTQLKCYVSCDFTRKKNFFFCLSWFLFSIKCFIECHKLSKYLYSILCIRSVWELVVQIFF